MNPNTSTVLNPRRGRPPKVDRQFDDTRQALIRSGLEVLTETGYLAAGIDAVIKNIAVPKGSFYHCFKSKEAFGLAVLAAYGDFFAHKLDKFLLDDAVPPLERMAAFVRHAGQGMEKFQFRRGCLGGQPAAGSPVVTRDVSPTVDGYPRRHGSRAWRAVCAKRRQPGPSPATPHRRRWPSVLDRLGRRGDARRAGPVCRTA